MRRNRHYLHGLLLAVVVTCCNRGLGQEEPATPEIALIKAINPPSHAWMYPIIASKASQQDAARPVVEMLQQSLKPGALPTAGENSPGCCLFVHIEPVRINPYVPHYLIVLHPGGGELRATDAEQLELGAQALVQAIRHDQHNGRDIIKLPIGVITNLPVTPPTTK